MNERFHCDIIGATVTPAICDGRISRQALDCSGCSKMQGIKPLIMTSEEIDEQSNGGVEMEVKKYEKKKCSCGCGKNAVKDGLSWACYVKKHGSAPYSNGKKPEARSQKPEARSQKPEARSQKPEASTLSSVSGTTNIMEVLQKKKTDLELEIIHIDTLIDALQKYIA